jgi:hypothetical protein
VLAVAVLVDKAEQTMLSLVLQTQVVVVAVVAVTPGHLVAVAALA